MRRFQAGEKGITVSLEPTEWTVLARLTTLLGSAGVEKGDPAWARLKPVLYPDDAGASREFERLTAKESAELRSSDRERFSESVRAAAGGTIVLASDGAASWARVLAESRIVLAARRGLFETGMSGEQYSDPEIALIALLGGFQEELVAEMIDMIGKTE
jgi:hypothetical protein